jgi:crotonobetainyl-CoA:carnitine CoA-transferase CaiB-like acyl-CoA transferase
MGQTGPLAQFAGYGNLAAALLGFNELAGWPDRPPAGPYGAYTDYVAPRFNAIAVLAALEHRRRTGQGQHIDLSQAEAAMHFLTPAILDYGANGRVQSRQGNDDPHAAPHGVYTAAGEDRHVAIACETDAHWHGLCRVVPGLDANDPRFRDHASRSHHRDAIDESIRAHTRQRTAESLEAALQAEGVPASVVQNSPELVRDPQLAHQGHFVTLPHAYGGHTAIEASRIRLSDTPACVDRSTPIFARDQAFVLRELLGYDEARIESLARLGVLK